MTPDELALVARLRDGGSYDLLMAAAREAADLIRTRAAQVPTAKPLMFWVIYGTDTWIGRTHDNVPAYEIVPMVNGHYKVFYLQGDDDRAGVEFDTLALAQAAAEADWQASWIAEWGGWA